MFCIRVRNKSNIKLLQRRYAKLQRVRAHFRPKTQNEYFDHNNAQNIFRLLDVFPNFLFT